MHIALFFVSRYLWPPSHGSIIILFVQCACINVINFVSNNMKKKKEFRIQQRDYSRIYSFNLKSATKHPIGQQHHHQQHENIWKHFCSRTKTHDTKNEEWKEKNVNNNEKNRNTTTTTAAAYFCGTETGFSARSLFSCLLIVSIYQ